MNVIWVRCDFSPADAFYGLRTWWPVYSDVHCDPEIPSVDAGRPHHHIAWNRLPERERRRIAGELPITRTNPPALREYESQGQILTSYVIPAHLVIARKRMPAPIRSGNVSPLLTESFVRSTWKEMRG